MTHGFARVEAIGMGPPAAAAGAGAVSARGPASKLLRPPPGEDFWVFGYGSLMWHPGFPHLEVRPAQIYGYHRHFCVFSHSYRGSKACPGLVLGLDRGGSCRGLAFRVPGAEGDEVLEYLYEREMVTGVYIPSWLKLKTAQGDIRAASFVVDPGHEQYTGHLSLEDTAELIVQGHGQKGACREYLANTVHHLEGLGIGAGSLKRLLKLVDRRCAESA